MIHVIFLRFLFAGWRNSKRRSGWLACPCPARSCPTLAFSCSRCVGTHAVVCLCVCVCVCVRACVRVCVNACIQLQGRHTHTERQTDRSTHPHTHTRLHHHHAHTPLCVYDTQVGRGESEAQFYAGSGPGGLGRRPHIIRAHRPSWGPPSRLF